MQVMPGTNGIPKEPFGTVEARLFIQQTFFLMPNQKRQAWKAYKQFIPHMDDDKIGPISKHSELLCQQTVLHVLNNQHILSQKLECNVLASQHQSSQSLLTP